MNKLHIFYRHVHIKHDGRSRDPGKVRPSWFSHEACYANLLSTLEQSVYAPQVTLTIIYDGTLDEYTQDFMHAYGGTPRVFPISVQLVSAGSNLASWHVALTQARDMAMGDGDLIYFLENDYLHLPGWLDKVFELQGSPVPFDYVSLYDHMDKYIYPMYADLQSRLFVSPSHHWRVAPSTCGTFLVKRQVFLEDLELWARDVQDHFQFAELAIHRNRVLLTPIPGLATHCMEGYLSPTIDWSAVR